MLIVFLSVKDQREKRGEQQHRLWLLTRLFTQPSFGLSNINRPLKSLRVGYRLTPVDDFIEASSPQRTEKQVAHNHPG